MEKLTQEEREQIQMFPEEARERLENMGFIERYWEKVMNSGFSGSVRGSHEVRALITIANGKEPQILRDVYREIRDKDKSGGKI